MESSPGWSTTSRCPRAPSEGETAGTRRFSTYLPSPRIIWRVSSAIAAHRSRSFCIDVDGRRCSLGGSSVFWTCAVCGLCSWRAGLRRRRSAAFFARRRLASCDAACLANATVDAVVARRCRAWRAEDCLNRCCIRGVLQIQSHGFEVCWLIYWRTVGRWLERGGKRKNKNLELAAQQRWSSIPHLPVQAELGR